MQFSTYDLSCAETAKMKPECRFDIKWIKSELLQTYENIDRDPSLREIERNYLKALHERSKLGQLPKQPSTKDYERLRAVYGMINNL